MGERRLQTSRLGWCPEEAVDCLPSYVPFEDWRAASTGGSWLDFSRRWKLLECRALCGVENEETLPYLSLAWGLVVSNRLKDRDLLSYAGLRSRLARPKDLASGSRTKPTTSWAYHLIY